MLEREKDVLSLVSNWKQFQMARDTWANEVTRKTTKSINSLEDIQVGVVVIGTSITLDLCVVL